MLRFLWQGEEGEETDGACRLPSARDGTATLHQNHQLSSHLRTGGMIPRDSLVREAHSLERGHSVAWTFDRLLELQNFGHQSIENSNYNSKR